jgi:hypothetical protein
MKDAYRFQQNGVPPVKYELILDCGASVPAPPVFFPERLTAKGSLNEDDYASADIPEKAGFRGNLFGGYGVGYRAAMAPAARIHMQTNQT